MEIVKTKGYLSAVEAPLSRRLGGPSCEIRPFQRPESVCELRLNGFLTFRGEPTFS